MEKKDILCPDCEVTYITTDRFDKFGKCTSCSRRETMSKTADVPYIKYKDLSDEEKVKITRQREIKNNSAKKVRAEQKALKNEPKNEPVITVTNEKKKSGRLQIYTPEIIEEIKTIANDNLTPVELLEILKGLHPELNINHSNLNNIIVRNKIPHSSIRGRKPGTTINKETKKVERPKVDNSIEEDLKEMQIIEPLVEEATANEVETYSVEDNTEQIVYVETETIEKTKPSVEDEPARFKPVRAEIEGVLQKEFKNHNCSVERDYSVDDYLKMLDMLLYFKDNRPSIIEHRKAQQNIMNAYQSDVIHELENVVLEDGNTYLSDKMHVIRQYRRYYEIDGKIVNMLHSFVEGLDKSIIEKLIKRISTLKDYVENPVFKPLVDNTMIDKYTWAHPINEMSYKDQISVTRYNPSKFQTNVTNTRPITRLNKNGNKMPVNTPPTSQFTSKAREALKVFRVSCRLSGGGYGVFREWYRDYECINSSIALDYAKKTLEALASEKKGVMWTDLSVIELNIDTGNVQPQTSGNGVLKPEPPKEEIVAPNTRKLYLYKVTCDLKDGKTNKVSNWTKEYRCQDVKTALSFGENTLRQLQRFNRDLSWTNVKAVCLGEK